MTASEWPRRVARGCARRRRGASAFLSVLAAAAVAVSVACGGSDPPPPAPTETPPATTPPAQTPSATPPPERTPSGAATATAAASAPPDNPDAAGGDPADLAAHLREKAMRLWEIYNTYDVDGLKVLYEESYWQEQEGSLRSNIRPFEQRGMTFEAEETSPPTEIEPGKWQIKHRARYPGGSVTMVFIFEQFDGEWLFTHAEVD